MKNIKKLFAALMALSLIFAVGAELCVSAANGFKVGLGGQLLSADTIKLSIFINDITVPGGLIAADLPLVFDDRVFEYVDRQPVYPSEWKNPDTFSLPAPDNGVLWLRPINDSADLGPESACSRSGAIGFYVTLRLKSGAPLGLTLVKIENNGGNMVPVGIDINIKSITGSGAAIKVMVTASGMESVTEVVEKDGGKGDVNMDGDADSLDASLILQHDAGLITLTGDALKNADVNGDGKADALDASLVLQYDAGLISSLSF